MGRRTITAHSPDFILATLLLMVLLVASTYLALCYSLFLTFHVDMDHLLDHLLAGSYMLDIDQRPRFIFAFLAMLLLQVLRPLGKFK
jgi:hypothetical protein